MKIESINPHNQSIVGDLTVSTPEEIHQAVEKARSAFLNWSGVDIKSRIEYIKKYREKLLENKEEIAKLVTLEMGKPVKQSLEDVDWEISFIDYYTEKGEENLSDEIVLSDNTGEFRIVYEPYGVCAVITPWNFPLSMVNSGILPAIIAGNTVVFKPSEYTSLSQKKVVELLQETGLPDGVVNVVIGDGMAGKTLLDESIDLVWFTGSTKTGQEIYKKCGEKFIKSICELGGSSAGIIFADAKLESTIENIFWSRFLNCGQVCSAVKRLFIEKSVYANVVDMLVEKVKNSKIGNPMEDVSFGPLVSKKQLLLLKEQVADALQKGAKVKIGGKQLEGSEFEKGNYFEPTILSNCNFDMRVMNEEVFGPVLPVMTFDLEEEVIEMANRTPYGLSSEVYTSDTERSKRVAKQLQSGVVAVNTGNYYKPACPIGGYKKSGIGREYGRVGMQEFSQIKLIAKA